jgi:hypothetical protein
VLETGLQQSDFEDWINADQDRPAVKLLTNEEIAASARKTGECVSDLVGLNISDCEDDVDGPSVSA